MKKAEEILKETLNLKGEITEKNYWMTVTVKDCLKAINKALAISRVGSAFYCQRDIEGDSICDTQCEHCNEYYKPLEQ